MKPGCNVGGDLNYPSGSPDPRYIKDLGFGWIRFVSQEGKEGYLGQCDSAGIATLGVVTEQSHGVILGTTWVAIGNEANSGDSNSADNMSAKAYAQYLQNYRNNIPADRPLIVGGLVAFGSVVYLKDVRDNGGLKGYSGIGLHYPRNVGDIDKWMQYSLGLPFWIDEWRTQGGLWDLAQIPDTQRMFRQHKRVVAHAPYCWSNGMVPGFGIMENLGLLNTITGFS